MSGIAPARTISTGIDGLDHVLGGGFIADQVYLIEGTPGAGKTTMALQFMLEGVRLGEPTLYITMSETAAELRAVAASHGWSLDNIFIRELIPGAAAADPNDQYTMFHPAEVELGLTVKAIVDDLARVQPRRAVIDSLAELRLMGGNTLRYRRQVVALKQHFAGRGCTLLLLDDSPGQDSDATVHTVVHGAVGLEQVRSEYGNDHRRLRVSKFRGRQFRAGSHDYTIQRGGLKVFPRLVAAEHREQLGGERIASGIPALDALLGGGIEPGASTLLTGAPGTGKSSIAMRFVWAAAERGRTAVMFAFDETLSTLLVRARGLGMDVQPHIQQGRVKIQPVDPAELSPGEFAHAIRAAVEDLHASLVVIDSLNGYLNAMPGERFLHMHLHELLMFLGQQGVATILVSAHQGLVGGQMNPVVDASYLADSVVLLRYFEAQGEVRQSISVIKKRTGAHERTIREFALDGRGIHVGEPLRQFRGVLTGVPVLDMPAAAAPPATPKQGP